MKIEDLLNLLMVGLLAKCNYQQEFSRANFVLSDLDVRASTINFVESDIETRCVTWNEFKQLVRNEVISLRSPVPELPHGYKNGCLLALQGEHTLIIHVFKDETKLDDIPINNNLRLISAHEIYQKIPPATLFAIDDFIDPYDPIQFMSIIFDDIWENSILHITKEHWDIARGISKEDYPIYYRTIAVYADPRDRELLQEIKQLLEATANRWTFQWQETDESFNHNDNQISCKLNNWSPDEMKPILFELIVTNHSNKSQNSVVAELEILNKHGDFIGKNNPFRRFQDFILDFEPPLEIGETRNITVSRKYQIGWDDVEMKTCKWFDVDPDSYVYRYPEMTYIFLP